MIVIGDMTLSSSEKSEMVDLANKCPYEYGPAIYMARALLMVNGEFNQFMNNCEISGTVKSLLGSEVGQTTNLSNSNPTKSFIGADHHVKIYPNPVTDNLVIECNDVVAGGTVRVYDVLGKQLIEYQIEKRYSVVEFS